MTFFASADRESQEPPQGAMLPREFSAVSKQTSEAVVGSFPRDSAQQLDELTFAGDWAQEMMREGWGS